MAEQRLTYKELQAEYEKALAEIKKLRNELDTTYQALQDCKDTLLKARAQLQLFKEVTKTQYFTTLNLKEI